MRITLRGRCDASLLNDELAAALGGAHRFIGSHNADEAIVDCEPADDATVRATIEAHLGRTPAQQAAALKEYQARMAIDGVDRVQFRMLFNLHNRVLVLEGRQQISPAEFRLIALDMWKQLNP